MHLWCWLALVAFIPVTSSTSPGVKVKITEKGLEYGKIGMVTLQQKLKAIKVPDISGTQKVAPIGKVRYSLSKMQIMNLGLPKSALTLAPGTGVSLSISNAFINLHGNWKVKYMNFIKDSGSFDLSVNGLTITTSISVKSDETGRPVVNSVNCGATVGSAKIKFHGGARSMWNKRPHIVHVCSNMLQICPLVADAISELNPHLKTLNVLAKVDKLAEIEYSMVSSPVISKSSIDLSLKGEFYNIGQHQEPPFSPKPFPMPPQVNNMLYIGVSTFTINSAAFVYNKAGALSLFITDDMIPPSSPIRLNTRTFGAFIPQIAKRFPGLMMKLLVKTVKDPGITLEGNNVTVQTTSTVTAYAIQPNSTLTPLFILNVDISVSARMYLTEMRLAGAVALNTMDMNLRTSYVGDFQVRPLQNIFQIVLKVAVIPRVNGELAMYFHAFTCSTVSTRRIYVHKVAQAAKRPRSPVLQS
uniref:Bactericidal permeability-increasing protein n=1 Tax=Myripristis murdjan TaxID=586833 RepID=A0A667YN55_9TELE